MSGVEYIALAVLLAGTALWAFRKGGKLEKARAKTRTQHSEIEALEARNEALQDTASDSSDGNRDFLRQFEGGSETD